MTDSVRIPFRTESSLYVPVKLSPYFPSPWFRIEEHGEEASLLPLGYSWHISDLLHWVLSNISLEFDSPYGVISTQHFLHG